jgi:hypothetical protein
MAIINVNKRKCWYEWENFIKKKYESESTKKFRYLALSLYFVETLVKIVINFFFFFEESCEIIFKSLNKLLDEWQHMSFSLGRFVTLSIIV